MRYSQSLCRGLSVEEVNEVLEGGSKIVWIAHRGDHHYDVAFEMAAPEPMLDAAAIILQFLNSVPPATMEEAMANNVDFNIGAGEAALRYLQGLVRSRVDGT